MKYDKVIELYGLERYEQNMLENGYLKEDIDKFTIIVNNVYKQFFKEFAESFSIKNDYVRKHDCKIPTRYFQYNGVSYNFTVVFTIFAETERESLFHDDVSFFKTFDISPFVILAEFGDQCEIFKGKSLSAIPKKFRMMENDRLALPFLIEDFIKFDTEVKRYIDCNFDEKVIEREVEKAESVLENAKGRLAFLKKIKE